MASAAAFAAGAVAPLCLAGAVAPGQVVVAVIPACVLLLAVLGALGAKVGGAPMARAALRVAFWGALAIALTAGVGRLVGAAV